MTTANDPECQEDQEGDLHRGEIVIQDGFVSMVSSVGSYSVVMGANVAREHQLQRRGISDHETSLSTMLSLLTSPPNVISEHEGTNEEATDAISGAGTGLETVLPAGNNHGTTMVSSVAIGEATVRAFPVSYGGPPEAAMSLFQSLELLERDLQVERAASKALREENDELVNDNHELVEDQKDLEGQLKETINKSGSFEQQIEEMKIELERLQEMELTIDSESCSLLVRQKLEDKTTQMQQRVQAAWCDKFMLEQHMQSLQQELNETHTAAEILLNQRNEFEYKAKRLQKQMKKCSCQDPLVFLPGCHLGCRARARHSLSDFLAGTAAAEQPCAPDTPARAVGGGRLRRLSMIPAMTINTTSNAQQHHNHDEVRRKTMSFVASKNRKHQPEEIASLAAAADVVLASHHPGPPSGEEDNIEPCQRNPTLAKLMSLGGGSDAEDLDTTSCTLSEILEADASGGGKPHSRTKPGWMEQLQNFMSSRQIDKFGSSVNQAQSQYHDRQGVDIMLSTSLSLTEHSILEAGVSQGEMDEDKQCGDTRTEQEGDTKKCMPPKENVMRHHSSFAPRNPESSLHMVNSIVLDLVHLLGTPFGQDTADQEEALREVVVASSVAVMALNGFPFQVAPAASVDESREKKETGYTRWSNEHTSGALADESMSVTDGSGIDGHTWFPEEEERNETKM
jgi:hypothetical protein